MACRVAAQTYLAVLDLPTVRCQTASWSLWSDPDNLVAFTSSPDMPVADLRRMVEREPGNVALRLKAFGRLYEETWRAFNQDLDLFSTYG